MPPQNEKVAGPLTEVVTPSVVNNPVSELTDDFIQVDDKVYSTLGLAAFHPGGDLFVKAFGGRDATEAFLSYHRREFPHNKVSEHLIGNGIRKKNIHSDADYLELCRIVENILPRNKSFAPPIYFVKIAIILSAALGLEFYIHYTAQYVWYLTAPLGWIMALIGLNIQHDANHGSISRNSTVNRVLGLTQNWIGGSALAWIHQHVVQHHIHCNDIHDDPDIDGNPILRLNPLKSLSKIHIVQHIYLFFLLALFGFTFIYDSLQNLLKSWHYTPFSKLVTQARNFELLFPCLLALRWLALPLYQKPSVLTVLNILPMFMVGGYYLSLFFVISHNFAGVTVLDKNAPDASESFLYKQVVTSSNVGGPFLCFMNGGLNYQIEHHLFPRVQHSHYPKISPVVREFCKSKGIPYVHFPTFFDNIKATVEHLSMMGGGAGTKIY